MFVHEDLTALAAQVRGGDRIAVAGLRAQLEPRLTQAVQQVLRTRSDSSALDRQILRELARCESSPDRQGVASRVARRLTALALAGLQRGTRSGLPQETVRGL